MSAIRARLSAGQANARISLLRVLLRLCSKYRTPATFLKGTQSSVYASAHFCVPPDFRLAVPVTEMSQHDSSMLVKGVAEQLLREGSNSGRTT